jgi:MtN3 and saliva related transmembrane protein
MLETMIGSIAATLTTVCFVPQAWKVIRTRDTQSLSLLMYLLFNLGVMCWLIYGFMLGSVPIILGNMVTLTLSFTILVYKIREERG